MLDTLETLDRLGTLEALWTAALQHAWNDGRLTFHAAGVPMKPGSNSAPGIQGVLPAPAGLGIIIYQYHPGAYVPAPQRQVFLQAVLRYWDEFEQVGQRYSSGSTHGESLWNLPLTIKYCLAHEGIPGETLRAPLPPGGLEELIQSAQA